MLRVSRTRRGMLFELVEHVLVSVMQVSPGGEGRSMVANTAGDPCDVFQPVVFLDLVAAEVIMVEECLLSRFAGLGRRG